MDQVMDLIISWHSNGPKPKINYHKLDISLGHTHMATDWCTKLNLLFDITFEEQLCENMASAR
jgi:hypothetical protein